MMEFLPVIVFCGKAILMLHGDYGGPCVNYYEEPKVCYSTMQRSTN